MYIKPIWQNKPVDTDITKEQLKKVYSIIFFQSIIIPLIGPYQETPKKSTCTLAPSS